MDRIFRHLGPVFAQVNKTLYTVLPILARALQALQVLYILQVL